MNKIRITLTFAGVLIALCIPEALSSQEKKDHFVGSTPCDPWIKSMILVDAQAPCEFLKWTMDLDLNSNTFSLHVVYGMSQPNTNGFQGEGTKLEITGNLVIAAKDLRGKKVYQLHSKKLRSPLALIRLDNNVFHMLDGNQNLLVGDGGYSYSLNRMNQ